MPSSRRRLRPTARGEPVLQLARFGRPVSASWSARWRILRLGPLALGDVDIHADQADDPAARHHRRQYRFHLALVRSPSPYTGFVAQGLAC